MNYYSYLITPFLAWLVAGCLKFLINSIKARQLAFGLIGYGGLPSNHSAIVSSMVALIAFKEGIDTPAFGVALTLAFIVLLDANSLRRAVGKHAVAINKLAKDDPKYQQLRERMGHTKIEILAGVIVGGVVGFLGSQL
ncbi:divergent PAP2 family protein [Acinetobacter baumannii]|uniref:divergent PAP2 family protein n=1 Tax=Acinetobacter calcoaceticus/baumannii complex TaxID=909768 RepID=UPI000DE6569D|nr:divergent PAP2 family protein [Acinetobacter nosocomialis]SSV63684.1 Divergent PAP2 family [Acinetobacter nosocomialis]